MADKPKTTTPAPIEDDGPSPDELGMSSLARTWKKFQAGKLTMEQIPPKMRRSIRQLQDAPDPDRLLPFSSHKLREQGPIKGEHIYYG